MGKQRTVTLTHCEEVQIKPKPGGGVPNPKILNISTPGGTAGGSITVKNGSGSPQTGGSSASTGPIPAQPSPPPDPPPPPFDDAFSVDVSKGVFLHFIGDAGQGSIEVTYDYE